MNDAPHQGMALKHKVVFVWLAVMGCGCAANEDEMDTAESAGAQSGSSREVWFSGGKWSGKTLSGNPRLIADLEMTFSGRDYTLRTEHRTDPLDQAGHWLSYTVDGRQKLFLMENDGKWKEECDVILDADHARQVTRHPDLLPEAFGRDAGWVYLDCGMVEHKIIHRPVRLAGER
jgi:hypothetical protein